MLTIPCIILLRTSCNSSALLILRIILNIIAKTIQELSKCYFIAKDDYSIRVIIIQPTNLIMC